MARDKFHHHLKNTSLKSVCCLARQAQLHRNTINHYLTGGVIYQSGFLKLCQTLKVSPSSIIEKSDTVSCLHPDIAKAVDQLHTTHPHLTFVLFGSRSKGLQKKYSDWDIGFFSMTTAITHQTHLDLLKQVDDLMEDSLETIDLVNLNLADHAFLSDNKYDFIFLTGCLTDWRLLQHKLLSYE